MFDTSLHLLARCIGLQESWVVSMASSASLAFLMLLLSSDNVCHKFCNLVCGTRELGWALPTCKVGEERQEWGRSNPWKQVWTNWKTSEGAKLVKAGRIFGVGFLSVVSEESDQSHSHRAKKAEASL